MPNLLAHYGAQGVVTRTILPGADVRWILLGAFIPDVPWITQRALQVVLPGLDLHALRLYAVVQASLFFALLLAAVFALLARRPGLVFAVLSLNVVLHFVLDSLQEKWGIGVHLLAPLRWDEWNAELFAMEGWITYGLTGLGLAFCVWAWKRREPGLSEARVPVRASGRAPSRSVPSTGVRAHRGARGVLPKPHGPARLGAAGLLVIGYLLLPVSFVDDALASNTHSMRTLVEIEDRPGRSITMDREDYVPRAEGDIIVMSVGDTLGLERRHLDRPATVSARGAFLDERTVRIEELQIHRPLIRDGASYLALLILAAYWIPWRQLRLRRGTGRGLEGSG